MGNTQSFLVLPPLPSSFAPRRRIPRLPLRPPTGGARAGTLSAPRSASRAARGALIARISASRTSSFSGRRVRREMAGYRDDGRRCVAPRRAKRSRTGRAPRIAGARSLGTGAHRVLERPFGPLKEELRRSQRHRVSH